MITDAQQETLAKIDNDCPGHCMAKFCHRTPYWMAIAERVAMGLGLDKSQPLDILDIGSGFGYFVLTCREHGHHVKAIDRPDPYVQYAAEELGAEFDPCEIKAFESLPDCGMFDLITTFGVNFRHSEKNYWDWREYMFLTQDILTHLNPNGRWVLRPNRKHLLDINWWKCMRDVVAVTINPLQVTVRTK